MAMPSALEVLRLTDSSIRVGCSTGKSAGFAPSSGSNLTERTVLILRTLLASAHSAWFGGAAR